MICQWCHRSFPHKKGRFCGSCYGPDQLQPKQKDKPMKPKKADVYVTRMSDDLLAPKVYVAEIREFPNGGVSYGVQFLGQRAAKWRRAKSEADARRRILAAVKLHRKTMTVKPSSGS